jgi:cell division ATPase FtsA
MTIQIKIWREALAKEPLKLAGRRSRPEIVHTSVYLPRGVHQHLREIAIRADCKIHDIIMEGIDAALRKHGHPSVNALKGRALKKGGR